jgi:hypothetical protein
VYNSETKTVEESIDIKFDDKEPDNKMLELVESFADIQISEDASEPLQVSGSAYEVSEPDGAPEVLEDDVPHETHPYDEDFEEAHDGLEESTQSKRTFKYKSTRPEELIIRNKDSPLKTRSVFKNESRLGLISLIEPTSVDEALSYDRWIVEMLEELNQFQRNEV